MRALVLPLLLALLPAAPASATIAPPAAGADQPAGISAERLVFPDARYAAANAQRAYGPFRVLDATTVALVGLTDEASPEAFREMLRDHPSLAALVFLDCPGTYDDRANLAVGRMIRAAGLAVRVPDGGSVRSGAVELVLAGTSIEIADGAEFAVHAWLDDAGYQAHDYAIDSAANRKYLAYYREMGMTEGEATAFYAMTNSVPFDDALWLDGTQMRRWIGRQTQAAPRLAYLDLGPALN